MLGAVGIGIYRYRSHSLLPANGRAPLCSSRCAWRPGAFQSALVVSQLGLARAYALEGDVAKSRAAYETLFANWKNADADLPILKQAKAEFAKLQ